MTPLTTEQVLDILWRQLDLALLNSLHTSSGTFPLRGFLNALEEAVRNLLTAHDVVPKEKP